MQRIAAYTQQGRELMHQGTQALARVESVGMRIDTDYLKQQIVEVGETIKQLRQELEESDVWKWWKRRFREKANIGSRAQLGTVLFDELELPCSRFTASGRPSTDESDLEAIDHPFVSSYLKIEKLKKLHSTYLKGIYREVEDDGFLHPSFNLNQARSYRSSSSNPNFQNIPIRNPEIAKIIRKAFIPRKNHIFLECDYSAIEVRVAACYHQDPTMLKYIETNHDMHKDMAVACFKLRPEEVTKQARHAAKNGFVFAEFYGDYYRKIAPNLWSMIQRNNLKTVSGVGLYEHLKQNGIAQLGACDTKMSPVPGTFEHHLLRVEKRFWEKQFPVYKEWKDDWWDRYCKAGWFPTFTGFAIHGVFSRNEVINYPIQGSAFHCVLWSLVKLVKWLVKEKLDSYVIGQIHDSMVMDVHKDEFDYVIEKVNHVMTQDVRKHWPWLITPLEIEAEASNKNWFEKKEIKI